MGSELEPGSLLRPHPFRLIHLSRALSPDLRRVLCYPIPLSALLTSHPVTKTTGDRQNRLRLAPGMVVGASESLTASEAAGFYCDYESTLNWSRFRDITAVIGRRKHEVGSEGCFSAYVPQPSTKTLRVWYSTARRLMRPQSGRSSGDVSTLRRLLRQPDSPRPFLRRRY